MADCAHTSLRLDGLQLDIRHSVACCERSLGSGVVFYLSLLDDEIDARCERFLASLDVAPGSAGLARLDGLADAASQLELTDAVVFHRCAGQIAVVRGGSCTFPLFWRRDARRVHLSTALPVRGGARLSRAGCAVALAAVCLQGSYELNACTDTPLHAWRRVRRGTLTLFADGTVCHEHAVRAPSAGTEHMAHAATIAARLREAFLAYGRSQRHVTTSVLELSGGFDSTLAGAAALTPPHTMHGISVEFPYYEFRFEAPVQRAVGAALGIPRTVLDGTQLFPYAPWEHRPRFDEPTVFVTGLRHAEQVARCAARHRATRIYVGHGGDQLFSTDLTTLEPVSRPLSRALFSRAAWRAVRRVLIQVRQPQWRQRATGLFVYDTRQDVWVKETFGVSIRTPFTDLALFRAALWWSRWHAARQTQPDKAILAHALGDLLPDAVLQRKGKVAYDGVWMRAYAVHGEHIAGTFERTAAVLEHIGIAPGWLLRRTRQLAAWHPVSDREVLAAYALAVWLRAWGIERVSEVAWA